MSKDDLLKLLISVLLAMCVGVAGMVGWWIRDLHGEVKGLRTDVRNLTIAVEVQAGGDPFHVEESQ